MEKPLKCATGEDITFHFLGKENDSSGASKAFYHWHYCMPAEDKSAKEITALPVSNNAVTVGVKVSCEHEDWVIQSNMELHFCLTIWQIWQDLQFCLFLLASALTHHQRRSCNRGAEVFKGLTNILILAYVLTESTNEPMGEMDGPFVQI